MKGANSPIKQIINSIAKQNTQETVVEQDPIFMNRKPPMNNLSSHKTQYRTVRTSARAHVIRDLQKNGMNP